MAHIFFPLFCLFLYSTYEGLVKVDFLRNQSHPLWTSEGKESHQATGSEQLGNQSFSTFILKNLLELQGSPVQCSQGE